jgi:transposase
MRSQLLHRGREQLVRQRTMLVNALRAHLAEFGMVAAQGLRNVGELIAIVRDDGDRRLPAVARQVLQVLANQIEQIEAAVAALERQLLAWHKTNAVSQRLASIPGIGPIIATAIATTVADPSVFRSGREFAAWLGLVSRQNSTGGKPRLGGITKRGNRYLRRLLINIERLAFFIGRQIGVFRDVVRRLVAICRLFVPSHAFHHGAFEFRDTRTDRPNDAPICPFSQQQ